MILGYLCDTQKQSSGEFAKVIGKQLCRSPYLNKAVGGRSIKERLQHSVFFHIFLTVLYTHSRNNWNLSRKVYFPNNWALFAVHVWFLYNGAKTY